MRSPASSLHSGIHALRTTKLRMQPRPGERAITLQNGSSAAGQVRISCVVDLETLWSRAGEWNRLVSANRTNTIFQTFEWHASWCRAFGSDVRLLVLLAESDAGLQGIAPLMVSERPLHRRRRRVVEFIGSDSADYCDFIVGSADVLPLFGEWLIQNRHVWDVVNLSNLADTSPLVDRLPEFFRPRGHPVLLRVLYDCPTRILGNTVEDREVLKKKSTRRHESHLRRVGVLEFRQFASAGEIKGFLDDFFAQHVRRWASAGSPSLFLDPRHRAFYRNLVELLVPRGWVSFSVLSVDQTPIAYHFGFEYHDRIYWIKPAFDPSYAVHAPGSVLLKHCLEEAMDRGVGEFDFTVGEESYKYRYANHARRAYLARVYRRRAPYHLDRFLVALRARLRSLEGLIAGRGEAPRQKPREEPAGAPLGGGPD
jgi:CelD/BcsL family acetyltransferase involved in cellulose biosynthesis